MARGYSVRTSPVNFALKQISSIILDASPRGGGGATVGGWGATSFTALAPTSATAPR